MIDFAPHKTRRRAPALVALIFVVAAATIAPTAHAVDLILLSGDPPRELSGVQTFGIVYVGNQVRLVGDTVLNADSVYFAPSSSLSTCFNVGDNNANACTVGRNLAIHATGTVTISNSFNTRAPDNETPRAGGSVTISASNITLGGTVNTSGRDRGASGNVSLSATGSIETQQLISRGANLTVAGAGGVTANSTLDVSADPNNSPLTSATRAPSSGHVALTSSAGDVSALGSILATGASATNPLSGGHGGTVQLSGRNVRAGFVDAGSGSGTGEGSAAGGAGSISLTAQGFAYALGTLDATGSNSALSAPSKGGAVSIIATGHVGASEIKAFGGNGPLGGGGGAGGSIAISAGSATLGNLDARGGSGTLGSVAGNGGKGGIITVVSPGAVTLGALVDAHGGTGQRPGLAGAGGTVDVSVGQLTAGFVTTAGGSYSGSAGASPGVDGGPLKLSAGGSLTASGAITSAGSSASGSADPAVNGGNGGPLTLRAATGALTLAAQASASGGSGGNNPTSAQPGGAGGHGGSVDVVSASLGPVASIVADGGAGGDSGDDQGPGGNGGLMRHWGDGSLYSDTFVASNSGGSGNTNGIDGGRVIEGAPTNLTINGSGRLAFRSRSPDADGFRISRTVADGPPTIIASETATNGIKARSPACQTAVFSVVAYHTLLGWTSTSPAPARYTSQPPGPQSCTDAPRLRLKKILDQKFKKTPRKFVVSPRKLKRNRWRLGVKFRAKGIGRFDLAVIGPRETLRASAGHRSLEIGAKKKRKTKKIGKKKVAVFAIAAGNIPKPGLRKASLVLGNKARKPGAYTLRLRTFAPGGPAKKTLKVRLEVRR